MNRVETNREVFVGPYEFRRDKLQALLFESAHDFPAQ
jgi:hypothetical protein